MGKTESFKKIRVEIQKIPPSNNKYQGRGTKWT